MQLKFNKNELRLPIVAIILIFLSLITAAFYGKAILKNGSSMIYYVVMPALLIVSLLIKNAVFLTATVGLSILKYIYAVIFCEPPFQYWRIRLPFAIHYLPDILNLAGFVTLLVLILLASGKKFDFSPNEKILAICKWTYYIPALLILVGSIIDTIICDDLKSYMPQTLTTRYFVAAYVLCIGFWVVFPHKLANIRAEQYAQATEELKDICSDLYGDGLYLKKQDPRISKLISIQAYKPYIHTQTPQRLVYTSGSAGGITIGGFHTVGGDIVRTDLSSDRFEICFWKKEWNRSTQTDEWVAKPIKLIRLSDELKEIAKKDTYVSDYLDKNGNIVVIEDFKMSAESATLMRGGYTMHAVNSYNMDKVDSYPDEYKCRWILDFVYGTNYNNVSEQA